MKVLYVCIYFLIAWCAVWQCDTFFSLEKTYEEHPLVSSFNVYLQTFLSQAIEPGFLAAITEGRAGLSKSGCWAMFLCQCRLTSGPFFCYFFTQSPTFGLLFHKRFLVSLPIMFIWTYQRNRIISLLFEIEWCFLFVIFNVQMFSLTF